MKNTIQFPELSLILLVGASGSGKSTFASKFFKPTEIVSSDFCRSLISDDENSLDANTDTFDLVHSIIAKRLKRGLLTVIDATNLRPEDRKKYVEIARQYHVLPCAISFNMPEKLCLKNNEARIDRTLPKHVIINQLTQFRKNIGKLKYEGFRHTFEFKSLEEIDNLQSIQREQLWNNRKEESGNFDIIGDIHGCYDELCELLNELGYHIDKDNHLINSYSSEIEKSNRLIFLGDLVDRGPDSPAVLKMVMNAVESGIAFCVPGNHDIKLMKYLNGKNVQIKHGLEQTVVQLSTETEEFRKKASIFIDSLVSHFVLDGGKLVVAHAGLKESMQGRGSGAVREFCLYGETTGETDEFGLPIRYNWASEYKGKATVVYGHTPVPEPQWLNNTIDIDTGCVFGGKLSALRYPSKEIVSIQAKQVYSEPIRPLIKIEQINIQQENDDVLDISDLIGKQYIETRLYGNITLRENNTIPALEAMSRFAVNPKWMIYLPPTMSPAETSKIPDLLEHPAEAFEYFKKNGVKTAICEEKHMGSRAIVIICKDESIVKKRFGIDNEGIGICYTRTGRRFFNDIALEQEFITIIRNILNEKGFWDEFATDWVCFDSELMPWSAKALSLLQNQYAAVGSSSSNALKESLAILEKTSIHQPVIESLLEKTRSRVKMSEKYIESYRQYCWEVESIFDYKLAPFHILATEGQTYFHKNHLWHLENIKKLCDGENNIFKATAYKIIDLDDEKSIEIGINWWENLTSNGGEGMVVKPLDFIVQNTKGLVQPAMKIRGKEYLRIIYGLEYTADENIKRLKNRNLKGKRTLALREFALGAEALEKFVAKESLRKVHQCVFGILALESEPIDPRL